MNPSPEQIVYLDNNATTRTDPRVVEAMLPYLADFYGNPSSIYGFGRQAAAAIAVARGQVARLLGCAPEEIVFTSSGTESDNAAIESALRMDPDRRHIVTTSVEHSAIHKQCEILARRGYPVTRLPVDALGRIDLADLERAITDETAVVSVMWANNETGVLFPVAEAAAIAAAKGTFFHTDAVQAVGKIPIDLARLPIHYLSLSGHKLHCPKGVGALYVNRKARFHPMLIGGGQESGRRGGTENVAGIVGLGLACELAGAALAHEETAVRALRDTFERRVLAEIPGATLNGDPDHRLPNTTSLAFEGCDGEGLLVLLDRAGVCASAGSACTTGSLTPSHVLTAMGMSADRARATLRFSFGRFNTEADVARGFEALRAAVDKLRSLRPPGEAVRVS
jgi:cysteine desulfurase